MTFAADRRSSLRKALEEGRRPCHTPPASTRWAHWPEAGPIIQQYPGGFPAMVTRAFSPFEGLHGGLLTTARGTPRVWMVLGTGGSCGSQCGLLTADCPPSGRPGVVIASQT